MSPIERGSHTDAQRWSAADYARNGRFVSDLGAGLLDWLDPRPGEHILDLGCGDGALTQRIAERGATVVGLDASADLLAAARARGLDVRQGDAQQLAFQSEFDAVFSNAALHWMKDDPDAVIAGVFRALRPGGRFVAEMGGDGNVASIRQGLHDALERRDVDAEAVDPWYFPDVADYHARLLVNGFRVARIERFERPTPLPGDVTGWLTTFAQPFLSSLAPQCREEMLAEVRNALRSRLADASGRWTADYVRLRFIAYRPENT
jgi:trans-aconitate methyltransferase